MSRTDRETPRSIAIIGIVMLLLTVVGFVVLGIVMKMNGYPKSEMIRWTPLALYLRQHGHRLVLVPVVWVVYAVVVFRLDRGIFAEGLAYFIATVLLLVVPMLFLIAIANPFTRPLLIYVGSKKTSTPPQTSAPTLGDANRPTAPPFRD
jgi:hypothetical protein